MKPLLLSGLFALSICSWPLTTTASSVSTFVGQVVYGNQHSRTDAFFDFPYDFEPTPAGGWLIADTSNHMIRRITASGRVKRVAGTGSIGDQIGLASESQFAFPKGLARIDKHRIVIADTNNNALKLITDQQVTTLTTDVQKPEDVIVIGNDVYIADTGHHAVKRFSLDTHRLTTLTTAVDTPTTLTASYDETSVYIADEGRHQILNWDTHASRLSVLAGSGQADQRDGACRSARFQFPASVAVVDADTLLVSDRSGLIDFVKQIELDGECSVETVFTDDALFTANAPRMLRVHDGQLYMLLSGYGFIDRFSLTDFTWIDRFAGADRYQVHSDHPMLTGRPKFLLLSPNKKWIYFLENNRLSRIRRQHPTQIQVIAGSVVDAYAKDDLKSKIGERARFSDPISFALSPDGHIAYVVDRNNHRIRKVDIQTKTVSYLTGAGGINDGGGVNGLQDGDACPNTFELAVPGCAYFSGPIGSVLSPSGKYLYVADSANNAIRQVTVTGSDVGRVITLAGTDTAGYRDGVGRQARFSAPISLTINPAGTKLYITDRDNHRIRQLQLSTRRVTTLAGAGRNGYREGSFDEAVFSYPDTLTLHNHVLYVAEVGSHRIRALDLRTHTTHLVAGAGRGFANGVADVALFHNPRSPILYKQTVFVADLFNDQIRKIKLDQ